MWESGSKLQTLEVFVDPDGLTGQAPAFGQVALVEGPTELNVEDCSEVGLQWLSGLTKLRKLQIPWPVDLDGVWGLEGVEELKLNSKPNDYVVT